MDRRLDAVESERTALSQLHLMLHGQPPPRSGSSRNSPLAPPYAAVLPSGSPTSPSFASANTGQPIILREGGPSAITAQLGSIQEQISAVLEAELTERKHQVATLSGQVLTLQDELTQLKRVVLLQAERIDNMQRLLHGAGSLNDSEVGQSELQQRVDSFLQVEPRGLSSLLAEVAELRHARQGDRDRALLGTARRCLNERLVRYAFSGPASGNLQQTTPHFTSIEDMEREFSHDPVCYAEACAKHAHLLRELDLATPAARRRQLLGLGSTYANDGSTVPIDLRAVAPGDLEAALSRALSCPDDAAALLHALKRTAGFFELPYLLAPLE
eukprot:TRINITY_DN15094_c0_g1_i1.p1 TRINITY_DN15094_c0_g1~~TRINITY_DN15094_c0_g1_i1.p1  ORF type:complete len:329 (+),score=66.80 TRINITY_DN15094_c0_g1_i1:550-1536(+)